MLKPSAKVVVVGIALLGFAAASSGCTKAGRSLVPVQVSTTDSSLTANLETVEIDVSQGGDTIQTTSFPWGQTHDFGVYLSSSVSGTVTITAKGFKGTQQIAQSTTPAATTSVTPGKTSASITITLVAYVAAGDGGTGGSGTGGTGPDGGATGGTNGTGGNSGATGGITGTGGGAGRAGTGGNGTGGAAGGGGRGGVGTGGLGTGGLGTGGVGIGGAGGGTGGRSWHGAVSADPGTLVNDLAPAAAVDSLGNVVVVYVHGSSLDANRNDATTGLWGTPVAIDARAGSTIGSPVVAVDGSGRFLVAWVQTSSAPTGVAGVWRSTSADGRTWTTPASVAVTPNADTQLAVAMNATGVAVIAWTNTNGSTPYNLMATVGSAGGTGTWSASTSLHAAHDNGQRFASAAVAGNGEIYLGWEQNDDGAADENSAFMAHYAAGTWTTSLLENYDAGSAYSVSVAANAAGRVAYSWFEITASTAQIWTRRLDGLGGITDAMAAEAADIAVEPSPSLTLDPMGNATLAFAVALTGQKFNVFTTQAAWNQAWQAAMAMETDNAAADDPQQQFARETFPTVQSDAAGNVVLSWRKRVGARYDVWARQYTLAGGWGGPTLLETDSTDSALFVTQAVGTNGTAAVAWFNDLTPPIFANIFR